MNKVLSLLRPQGTKLGQKPAVSLERKKARAGWAFVMPFVIGFVLIYIPMILQSLVYTMAKVTAIKLSEGTYRIDFVGFDNFQAVLFDTTTFAETLISGTTQLLIDIPAIIIFSLFMAVILNQKMLGRAVFRAIFFVPVIVSTGIIAQVDLATTAASNQMGNGVEDGNQAQGGGSASDLISAADISGLFSSMKVGAGLVTYVVQIINNIYNIVNRSGVQMLIFLAGLQSISPAIYESVQIDGATSWETFWKITFPMISPMILVNGIYTIIDSFTNSQNVVMAYIADTYSKGSEVLSSAMAWIYFLIVIVVVAIIGAIFSAFVFYGRKSE